MDSAISHSSTGKVRVVDRYVQHGGLLSFAELARRAIPAHTRYLVLDLDKTIHLEQNMGELLGWEICAYNGYGERYLTDIAASRPPGRFFWQTQNPWRSAAYFMAGARLWIRPGLFYLTWAKMAARINRLRRSSFHRFGAEPIRFVQTTPQAVLLDQMARLPVSVARELFQRVWERYQEHQVITRENLQTIRRAAPHIRIIVASASPKPVVEEAAAQLGADDYTYTRIEEHDGFSSAPYHLDWLLAGQKPPRRIAPPSSVHINSSHGKIQELARRFGDMFDPDVLAIGITDTSYGEDHAWAQYFKRVIDINSPDPFPPVVNASSPLEEIHSAHVLSQREQQLLATNPQAKIRRPRGIRASSRVFDANELQHRLGHVLQQLNELTHVYESATLSMAQMRQPLVDEVATSFAEIENAITDYNELPSRGAQKRLVRFLRKYKLAQQQLSRLDFPLSDIAYALRTWVDRSLNLLER